MDENRGTIPFLLSQPRQHFRLRPAHCFHNRAILNAPVFLFYIVNLAFFWKYQLDCFCLGKEWPAKRYGL